MSTEVDLATEEVDDCSRTFVEEADELHALCRAIADSGGARGDAALRAAAIVRPRARLVARPP